MTLLHTSIVQRVVRDFKLCILRVLSAEQENRKLSKTYYIIIVLVIHYYVLTTNNIHVPSNQGQVLHVDVHKL